MMISLATSYHLRHLTKLAIDCGGGLGCDVLELESLSQHVKNPPYINAHKDFEKHDIFRVILVAF